jgi:ornithine carbamoyltransferase
MTVATKHLLTLGDLGREGLLKLLDDADLFKRRRGAPAHRQYLAGRSVALVFEKASTRTRISLEVAVGELGGTPLVITKSGSQLDRGEPLQDTARVLSRMVHAITFRTFSDANLHALAENSSVPVLNALTDGGHPMQLLADLQTVRREFGTLQGLKYAWIGDGNNMANSWIEAAGLLELNLDIACPAGFDPDLELIRKANEAGALVRIVRDPETAASGAHVVNTDVFASMGQEQEAAARAESFEGYCVTTELMSRASKDAIALHCLPAHRGEEIAAAVIDGPQSRVWDQAEARLHTAKAALCWALDVQVQ